MTWLCLQSQKADAECKEQVGQVRIFCELIAEVEGAYVKRRPIWAAPAAYLGEVMLARRMRAVPGPMLLEYRCGKGHFVATDCTDFTDLPSTNKSSVLQTLLPEVKE